MGNTNMARTLEQFREQTLRVLKEICPDEPLYIRRWMKAFDKKHGLIQERPRRRLRKQVSRPQK
jgi:hypothetical protein